MLRVARVQHCFMSENLAAGGTRALDTRQSAGGRRHTYRTYASVSSRATMERCGRMLYAGGRIGHGYTGNVPGGAPTALGVIPPEILMTKEK